MKHCLFEAWLSTTDCGASYNNRLKHRIVFESDTHIVFKHGAHASYVNRMTGTKNCPVYHVLFEKATIDLRNNGFINNFHRGDGYVKMYHGRLTTKKVAELIEADFGLTFSADYQSPEWYEPAPPEVSEFTKQMMARESWGDIKL